MNNPSLLAAPLQIGNVSVQSRIFLAPMAGVTDLPMRVMCRRMGCAMVYTEMVSANALIRDGQRTQMMLTTLPEEGPLGVQLFGSDPKTMAAVARSLCHIMGGRVSLIDINMGCPANKIIGNGEGGALLKDLPLAAKIMEAVVKASDIPVTVKFRRRYSNDGSDVVREMAHIASESGVSAITLHARTVQQGYSGQADWDVIALAKASSRIPVVGNGDVKTYQDAVRMQEETGCDAVMVGRAAVGNPWIFSNDPPPSPVDRFQAACDHLALQMDYRENDRLALNVMRKHLDGYITGLPGASEARTVIHQTQTEQEMIAALMHAFGILPQAASRSPLIKPYVCKPHAQAGHLPSPERPWESGHAHYDRPYERSGNQKYFRNKTSEWRLPT